MFNKCCQPRMNMCCEPRMNMGCEPRPNMCCEPRQNMCCEQKVCCDPKVLYDPCVTNCVEKEFYHEIQHVIPVHTHVINKHIYNHTYAPEFSCSEECQVINNECNRCNNFPNR